MKRHSKKTRTSRADVLKLAALGSAGLGLVCGAKADSIITFGGFAADNIQIDTVPGFGNNISVTTPDYTATPGLGGILGTPDITLTWSANWDSYLNWDGRGAVGQTDFNRGSAASILFTPTSAFAIQLRSFDLDEWAAGGDGSINWSITGPISGTLASGNWMMTTAGGRTAITPNAAGQIGEALTLNLELGGGAPSYFALDNLTFAQVPEPSAMGLGVLAAAGALGAAAMRRRKRA
jgi:hypothetical protein